MSVWTKLSIASHFGGVAPHLACFEKELADANALALAIHEGGFVSGIDATQDPHAPDADAVCFPTTNEPTAGELAAVVALAAVHDPNSLTIQKKARQLAVDMKTAGLIAAGLSHAGKVFSMSDAAQRNAMGVLNNGIANQFTYPYPYSTLAGSDDSGYHEFANASEVTTMANAMKDRLKDLVADGSDLKRSIWEATTQAELDAVVDART